MAISRIHKLNWEDIQAIYTSLNEAREKFEMEAVDAIPEQPTTVVTDTIVDLKEEIEAMSSNEYISDIVAIVTSEVEIPETQTLIYPKELAIMKGTIDEILTICPHNAIYNASVGGSSGGGGGGGDSYGCNVFHSDTVNTSQSWCSGFNHTGLGTNSF